MDLSTQQQLIDAARAQAKAFDIDEDLATAICFVESGWNPLATRYEPAFKYFNDPAKWAAICGITAETEQMFQACSWGLMQVMGAVARDLGYKDPLVNLCSMWTGTEIGCKKLATLFAKYPDENDTIAAYNAGSPRRDPVTSRYVNQDYVDQVCRKLLELRKIK